MLFRSQIVIGVVKGSHAFTDFLSRPFEIGDVPQVNAQFSHRYAAANALLRRDSLKEHFTDEFISDPRVQELVRKVKQVEVFQPLVGVLPPVRVEIRIKDGKSYSMELHIPKGFPQRPLSKETIVDKFRDNVAYSAKTSKVLLRERGEEILALVEHLEELDNVNQIVELIVARD